ncbi:CGNR zinc finger domain-containing protein [Streptomyces sp. E11-3]|uniref:CGNR zinc finger domain-containing protein n=1 Tax=Streptomyces sp. E11-3 TaxID=3110112 RepID=UPI0039815B6E
MSGATVTQGFRPAHRLIEIANAVREDPALSRDALADLLRRHGETPDDVTEAAFTATDAEELRSATARLTDVLTETDTDRAALALNALLEECGARPRLSRHDGHAWHLHVDRGEDAGWADWFTASGALALAQLLSEHGHPAWGTCAAPDCTTLYLATGPGTPRRYCSPRCASRTRVAAHRERNRTPSDDPASRS